MPLGRDGVPERSRVPSDPAAGTAQRWLRMGRKSDGGHVPLGLHLRREPQHLLRCHVPPPPLSSILLDGFRVLMEPQPVPRLRPTIRHSQLRTVYVGRDLRRKQLRMELQAEQVPLRLTQQCMRMAATKQRFDVPRSMLVQRRTGILLQRSMPRCNDGVRVQPVVLSGLLMVQRKVPRLQCSVRKLRVQQCHESSVMREELRLERSHDDVLVTACNRNALRQRKLANAYTNSTQLQSPSPHSICAISRSCFLAGLAPCSYCGVRRTTTRPQPIFKSQTETEKWCYTEFSRVDGRTFIVSIILLVSN